MEPRRTLAAALIGGTAVYAGAWAYGLARPVTPEEKALALPGDELLADEPHRRIEVAITINASPEQIWPYLAQLGQRKAGFYSFSILEQLTGFHIYNTYRVIPEWAHKEPGEFMYYHQAGVGSEIVEVQENSYFTSISDSRRSAKDPGAIGLVPPGCDFFAWTWNFHLLPQPDGATRLLCRTDVAWAPMDAVRFTYLAGTLGAASFMMLHRMLETIKKCSEGRHPAYSRDERFWRIMGAKH